MPAAQQVRDLVDNMMRTALLDLDHKVSLLATHHQPVGGRGR